VLVLTIWTNGELPLPDEVDEVDAFEPRLPEAVPDEALDDPDVDPVEAVPVEAVPVEAPVPLAVLPLDTLSPGERLASDAIVPLAGA
jgi:hypothetical protein